MALPWGEIIKFAVPFVTRFFGSDDAAPAEDKRNLVMQPTRPELEKDRGDGTPKWSPTARFSNINSQKAQPVGATPALRSASPSELSSRYWAAIYSDAKRRSEIR
jgi:hypothetical protein